MIDCNETVNKAKRGRRNQNLQNDLKITLKYLVNSRISGKLLPLKTF